MLYCIWYQFPQRLVVSLKTKCCGCSEDLFIVVLRRRWLRTSRGSCRNRRRSYHGCALLRLPHLVVQLLNILLVAVRQPGELVHPGRTDADGRGARLRVDVVPALLAAGDVGGGLLALEDLVGGPVDDLLGPLEAALVAPAGPGAQDGLAAPLGLLCDAGVLVQAEDGGAGVDGLGRRPGVLERLVGVDAGRCGSAGGARVDGGRCGCVSDVKIPQSLWGMSASACLRNRVPLPFVFAILLAVEKCCVWGDLEILVSIRV